MPAEPGAGSAGTELSASTGALRVRGLTVRTGKGSLTSTLVSDVDLDLAEGAALGIVGESGCGKTTTLRAVAGLLGRGSPGEI